MISIPRPILHLLPVLALVVFVIWWDQPPSLLPETPAPEAVQRVLYIDQLSHRLYDENGQARVLLQAARMDGDSSGRSQLQQVDGTLYPSSGSWQIHAQRALRESTLSDWLRLEGEVVFEQPQQQLQLRTDWLELHPSDKLVRTSAPVSLFTLQGKTDAVGLDANLEQQIYHLQRNIRSVYQNAP